MSAKLDLDSMVRSRTIEKKQALGRIICASCVRVSESGTVKKKPPGEKKNTRRGKKKGGEKRGGGVEKEKLKEIYIYLFLRVRH